MGRGPYPALTSALPAEDLLLQRFLSMIRLRVLGVSDLCRSDGVTVDSLLAQPKRLALLAYLVLARPRGFHRRDHLLGLFWPELDQERARNALNQSVHYLRRSLGREVIESRGNDELGVAPGSLYCDALELEEAASAGSGSDIADLYGGDLLPGLYVPETASFESWLELERTRLRRLAVDGLRKEAADAADPPAAVTLLRAAVQIDPLNEESARRLITALHVSGDRSAALQEYEQLAERLERDLQVEPEPSTRSLREQVAGKSRPAPVPSVASVHTSKPHAGSAADSHPAQPPKAAEPDRPSITRGRLWGLMAAAAAAVLLVVLAVTWNGAREPAAAAPSGAVLVAPFAAAHGDVDLARFGRDAALVVSIGLDATGAMRTVDGVTAVGQFAADEPVALESARSVALNLGAEFLVHGTLVSSADQVRLEAALYRAEDARPLARAAVRGSAADPGALGDSLVWALLAEALPTVAGSPTSRGALGTRSVPALRAFLEGERAIAEGRMREAPAAYRRAMELDSTYWFAYWRYAYTRDYRGLPVDSSVRVAYRTHSTAFPEPDRLLIAADDGRDLRARIAAARELTERHPFYWFGWFQLADILVHDAPFLGGDADDARAALERTLALNPGNSVVWQHFFWLAIRQADTTATALALKRLESLRYDSASLQDAGLDQLAYFRWLHAAASGNAPGALTDSLANMLVGYTGPIDRDQFAGGASLYGLHEAQIDFSRRVLARPVSGTMAGVHLRSIMMAQAARGDWPSALESGRRYVAWEGGTSTAGVPGIHVYRVAVVGEWLGGLPAGAADEWQSLAHSHDLELDPAGRAELAWLDGVLAAAREELDQLREARRGVLHADPVTGPWLARSLAAFELALREEWLPAVDSMIAVERERADEFGFKSMANLHPFTIALDRLALGQWALQAGEPQRALPWLTWYESVQFPAYLAAHADATLAGPAALLRARITGQLGRQNEARTHAGAFLRLYDQPGPGFQSGLETAYRILGDAR
jgi:DNA-binding SARP family transcriptional activator